MKKIRLFIITYKRNDILSETIDYILNSDFMTVCDGEIYVISNHTSTKLKEEHKDKVKIIKNEGRPDWSNGNLSESWNQAIVHGFHDLSKPKCDYVVGFQNDAICDKNWCSNLIKLHESFDYVQGRYGDNIISFSPEHIKKVGLYDERFCGIQYHFADYIIRSIQNNRERTYVDDIMHRITFNNNPSLTLDVPGNRNINEDLKRRPDDGEQSIIWQNSRTGIYPRHAWNYFLYKWGGTHPKSLSRDTWTQNWTEDFKNNIPTGQKKEFVRYPYFEKDINKGIYEIGW